MMAIVAMEMSQTIHSVIIAPYSKGLSRRLSILKPPAFL